MKEIRAIIEAAELSSGVKTLALRIFRRLAEAEGRVHGKDWSEVHFHEVGAVDSIVDIVGAAICHEYLGVTRVTSGRVELGSGTVRCAHGVMPVPAPATAELVKGMDVAIGGTGFESTTPTGAAILAGFDAEFGARISGRIVATGTGLGQKDVPGSVPNVLRVMLVEEDGGEGGTEDIASGDVAVEEIMANVDDMTGEELAYLTARLLAAGADDAWQETLLMKKGRVGVKVVALVKPERKDAVIREFFRHGRTLGVRWTAMGKRELPRRIASVECENERVGVKWARRPDGRQTAKYEYADLERLAESWDMTLDEVRLRLDGVCAANGDRKGGDRDGE